MTRSAACSLRRGFYDHGGVHEVAAAEPAGRTAEAVAVDLDRGAHAVQCARVAEAPLVDGLVHDGASLGLCQSDDERLLPVGHESGMHVGLERHGLQISARVPEVDAATDRVVVDLERAADPT